MGKLPKSHRFLDLSDYGRPFGNGLVILLLSTSISPIHITLLYTFIGFLAAFLIAENHLLGLAGGLLILKSILDAADGALARARNRPSRVGRFLDSVCDFWVSAGVFLALALQAYTKGQEFWVFLLAAFSFLSVLIQGSLYNYYSIRYRNQMQGDTTSHLQENEPAGYPWDDPKILSFLHRIYRLLYSWQDRFVAYLDCLSGIQKFSLNSSFMTAVSVMGLGAQLLIISFCLFLAKPTWALWIFPFFNFYALALLSLGKKLLKTNNQ